MTKYVSKSSPSSGCISVLLVSSRSSASLSSDSASSSQEGSGSLPAGSEDILQTPYSDTFSCEVQGYGYYADVQSGCQVFHICLPIEDNEGAVIETAKWSFFCGNGTVFDQETLTSNFPDNAFPCEESPSLYGAVEFGKIPDDY